MHCLSKRGIILTKYCRKTHLCFPPHGQKRRNVIKNCNVVSRAWNKWSVIVVKNAKMQIIKLGRIFKLSPFILLLIRIRWMKLVWRFQASRACGKTWWRRKWAGRSIVYWRHSRGRDSRLTSLDRNFLLYIYFYTLIEEYCITVCVILLHIKRLNYTIIQIN